MPNSATAEVYFIAAMMILILIMSAVSVYIFFRTYKREMIAKQKRIERKREEQARKENAQK